jgi:serine phosphatase RsbU (regulator of sigma subunit)/anti-sigma regulatory factor (Ser/Thr protein kinase)
MDRDEASRRLRDLEQVTDAALSYLPLEELLNQLLLRVVEIIGTDTAAILLLEEDGRMLAARAAKGLEEEVEQRVRIPVGRGFAGRIAAEKRPVRIPDVDHADILNPILREKGLKSLLGAPMLVEGEVIGVVHTGTLTPREFTDEDEDLLLRAADRAALAVSARLYERQRGLTEEIQQSLIPRSLPEFPGVALTGRYRPAEAAPLGGDWYDAFTLTGGAVGLAIGDVVGRGFKAAAMMGQLRSALRAYAFDDESPLSLLSKLNVLLRRIEPGASATLLYILFDPDTGRTTLASAGHLPPILVSAEGVADFIELPPGPPLGVSVNPPYDERTLDLEPPNRLLLYTDGVMERPGESLDDGLERLRAVVPGLEVAGPEACDNVLSALVAAGDLRDDAALLVLDTAELKEELVVTLPAEQDSPPLLRRLLRRWLRERGAAQRESDELVLACAEACANAIEHAYPPEPHPFQVEAVKRDGEITLTVRDWGTWRPPRGDYRGRGLILMEGLTDSVDVSPSDDGTTVTLKKKLAGVTCCS